MPAPSLASPTQRLQWSLCLPKTTGLRWGKEGKSMEGGTRKVGKCAWVIRGSPGRGRKGEPAKPRARPPPAQALDILTSNPQGQAKVQKGESHPLLGHHRTVPFGAFSMFHPRGHSEHELCPSQGKHPRSCHQMRAVPKAI